MESASPTVSSRSYGSIVRANVVTLSNLSLAVFGTITLLYGDWRDALFLGSSWPTPHRRPGGTTSALRRASRMAPSP